jgi:glutathione S-transferase
MPVSKKSKKTAPEYVLYYWPLRGRGECIRLTMALCGLEWKEEHNTDDIVAETKKKAGTAESPFGQWPMLKEDGVILAQAHAILKHLGRQHGLYGSRNKMEDFLADSFMIGADALRTAVSNMIWVHGNTEQAKEDFLKNHVYHESKTGRCEGAHLAFLEGFLERSPTQWVAGGKNLSVADVVLFDLYDNIINHFSAEKINALYPKCAALHKAVSEIEEIAEYLKSEKRLKA